jgi:dTMP kinase
MLGKFIVFEGIDGCGKGTQLKLASGYVFDLSKDYDVFVTREPTRDFKEIRLRLAAGKSSDDDADWYARAFFQDRLNHVKEYILPMLNKGTHVLSDRYKYSTITYQHAQGLDLNSLIEMHKSILVPDLAMVFDLPAEAAFERRGKEGAPDVFDRDLAFQETLRRGYLNLKKALPEENIVVINANRPIADVFKDVKCCIGALLRP